MHSRITEAIRDALSKNDEERMKITIYPKMTGGFWSMKIVLKPKYKHLTSHVSAVAMQIGRFYGEGLNIQIEGRTIKVN